MILLLLVALLPAQTLPPARRFEPKPPPAQPLPFSHKVHTAQGVRCLDCHAIRPPGDQAGFPAEAACMGCHASVKKDSPHIQKLAAFAAARNRIPWVRVYRLPKTVYFSHEVHHRQAGVACADCHGPVAEREAIGLEKSIHMAACMSCHEQRKASNKCDLCHDSH